MPGRNTTSRMLVLSLLSVLGYGCTDKTTLTTTETVDASVRVVGAASIDNTQIVVSFSAAMDDSALDVSRYSITQENVNSEAGRLIAMAAEFDSESASSVRLTTRSQNDVSYRLTVSDMRDALGNPLSGNQDSRRASFAGTPPTAAESVDSDGDGLFDHEEQRGWTTTILLAGGDGRSWEVSSDPAVSDTDADGLTDDYEKQLGTDPRDPDTDDDGLGDYQEFAEIYSSATRQDTDGDGLADGREFNLFRTSPSHSDSDGDQLPDGDEILLTNRNPRAADLPLPGLEIGDVDLRLDVRFTASSSQGSRELESKSVTSTLSQTESRTYTNADSATHEVMAKAAVEAEYSAKAGVDGVGYSVKGTVEAGYSGGWTSSFTAESASETQKRVSRAFSSDQEVSNRETVQREVVSASMKVALNIRSIGNIAFTVSNLQVTALLQDPGDPSRLVPIATLVPDPATGVPNSFNLGPLVPVRGPFVFSSDQIFPSLVEDLMTDPRGLVFKIANFDIVDEFDRNFAFTSQAINDRTTPLVIDFGGADSDGDGEGDTTDRFHLATSAGRPIADTNNDGVVDGLDRRAVFDPEGRTVGITVGEALEGIVGLQHFDEDDRPADSLNALDLENSYSTRIVNGVRVLWRVRGVAKELNNPLRQWEILTPDGIAARDRDMREIVIAPENGITFAHVQDLDDDRIPARWEYIHGCSDTQADTDGDGLEDSLELFVGWTINVVGRRSYRTFAGCARRDSDRDGISDDNEVNRLADLDTDGDGQADLFDVAAPTDPRRFDTDGDGVSDFDEQNGYSVELRTDSVDAESACSPEGVTGTGRTIRCTSDPLNPDSDGDTLQDGDERTLGTDPTVADGDKVFDDDGDGLSNFDEMTGFAVRWEQVSDTPNVDGPIVTCTPANDGNPDCDGANEPTSDPQNADSDGDGLSDFEEREFGTHPRLADTDADGLTDFVEVSGISGTCDDQMLSALTDPLDADGDNDLLADGVEVSAWSDNSWIVRVTGETPYRACPDPEVADADLDQLVDGEEFAVVDSLGNPTPVDPNLFDTDGDGISDARETATDRPTDPLTEDKWLEFRYTRIVALSSCDGGPIFPDPTGEFTGVLALQRGVMSEDVFVLEGGLINLGMRPLMAGDIVEVNEVRDYVLQNGESVIAFSHDFWECDSLLCLTQINTDDDLSEFSEEYPFGPANQSDTFVFEHSCGSSNSGLQTTLVVTELE